MTWMAQTQPTGTRTARSSVWLDDKSAAFYFDSAQSQGPVNSKIAGRAVLVWVGGQRRIRVYSRNSEGRTLDFHETDGWLVDSDTGPLWDPVSGAAVEGELVGQQLDSIPFRAAYDWAWQDFFPESVFYPDFRR